LSWRVLFTALEGYFHGGYWPGGFNFTDLEGISWRVIGLEGLITQIWRVFTMEGIGLEVLISQIWRVSIFVLKTTFSLRNPNAISNKKCLYSSCPKRVTPKSVPFFEKSQTPIHTKMHNTVQKVLPFSENL